MGEVNSVLVLGGLSLDLVNGVEGECCLELREILAETANETSRLGAKGDNFKIM